MKRLCHRSAEDGLGSMYRLLYDHRHRVFETTDDTVKRNFQFPASAYRAGYLDPLANNPLFESEAI